MTNKKVRTWLIFFVKLLPLILIIGFMLYFFRHEFPETEDVFGGEYVEYEYYSWEEFTELILADGCPQEMFVDFNVLNLNDFFYVDDFVFMNCADFNLVVDDYSNPWCAFGVVLDPWNYQCSFEFVDIADESRGDWAISYNFIYDDLSFNLNNYNNLVSLNFRTSYSDCPFIKEVKSITTYEYDHTNYFDNIVKQFDDFTTSNFNFIDSLNFNDFYNFTVEHLVHNPSPIYHSVFNIMIYEVIVDLMLLLFGAFAFVINWSRKWLEGIYEKW